MRKDLDCRSCSFRTWLRAADLKIGHSQSIRQDEVLVKEHRVCDIEEASFLKEVVKHAKSPSYLSYQLVIHCVGSFSNYTFRFLDAPRGLNK
jgi:hypothetical protein